MDVKKGKCIMEKQLQSELKTRFMAATESFINKIKEDPNVIAIILCGSLAYDLVWEKSDVDMTVLIRDQNIKNDSYCIVEDDILINVHLVTRSEFKREVEKSLGGSFLQSYFAQGKILYTSDDSLYEYFEDIKQMGKDDIALSVFYKATYLIAIYNKSRKWLYVKKEPLYAQYYLIAAANPIADIEVCLSGETPTRESILKAISLNPEQIKPYYQEAMSHLYSFEELEKAIDGIDQFLMKHLDIIKKPVIDFMSDQQLKTVTLISKHLHSDGHSIEPVLDYLWEKGVIEKVSQTIRITPKSRLAVEEIGYLYIP